MWPRPMLAKTCNFCGPKKVSTLAAAKAEGWGRSDRAAPAASAQHPEEGAPGRLVRREEARESFFHADWAHRRQLRSGRNEKVH